MQEPHEIQERIDAHYKVIAIIAEELHDYELMLEENLRIPLEKMSFFQHKKIKQIKVTMEILYENRYWNEDMIDSLEEQYNEALHKETRGW